MNKPKLISFLVVFCVLLSTNILLADNKNIRSPKAKERMDMVKKMKMIEAMGLDETKSEKFLLKFNAHNKHLEEIRKQQQNLANRLDESLKNNSKDLSAITEQMLNLQDELNRINIEKRRELKGILTETEFAKYLVFESKFMRELFNCFIDNNHREIKGDKSKNQKKDRKNNATKSRKKMDSNKGN